MNTDNINANELLKVFTIKELVQIKIRRKFEIELNNAEDIDDVRNNLLFDETVQEYLRCQEEQGISDLNIWNGTADENADVFYDQE